MRALRFALALGLAALSTAAPARTYIIFVEPMSFDTHTQVLQTPGPDRFLMCMQPPSLSGCREVSAKRR